MQYRQHSCGCTAHRPQITHHRGSRMTHCIPTAFLQKISTARSLPSVCAVSCSYRNTQLCAFLLGCILFHPDRLLGLPSPFSELHPRLPERVRALMAWCTPCLWSACSFFNTLQCIQEECGDTRPTTVPHLTWFSSSSPLMSPVSLLSIYRRAEGKVPFGFFLALGFPRGRHGHFVPCRAHPSVCQSLLGHSLGHTGRRAWVEL